MARPASRVMRSIVHARTSRGESNSAPPPAPGEPLAAWHAPTGPAGASFRCVHASARYARGPAPAAIEVEGGSPVPTRREFVRWTTCLLGGSLAAGGEARAGPPPAPAGAGSDVGSLFPFIRGQVPREFPLSFLRDEFKDPDAWKRQARGKLLELLHYAPPRCDPKPEVVEKSDRGDYLQEKVYFNTTPDIRVPGNVLIPKKARFPAPALVALHDHAGFYLWGTEKLMESPGEHRVLTTFKKHYYAGNSIAADLARQGYVVVVIDMFYWGERRMLLDDDPADWRERPASITAERIREFNTRASQNEQLVGRTIYAAGFTWSGVLFWDDMRTVDYLLTRPEVDPKPV